MTHSSPSPVARAPRASPSRPLAPDGALPSLLASWAAARGTAFGPERRPARAGPSEEDDEVELLQVDLDVAARETPPPAPPPPPLVQSYCGRSLIAPNGAFEEGIMDSRGYVPVEW